MGVRGPSVVRERYDLLGIETELVAAYRGFQASHPFHFVVTRSQHLVFRTEHLHLVLAVFLRHVAGEVRGLHHILQGVHLRRRYDESHAHTCRESPIGPDETEFGNRAADLLGNTRCLRTRAMREHDAELITTETTQDIRAAQAPYQCGAD